MAEFAYDPEAALSPAQVADCMLEMIQQGTYTGGSILEIGAGGKRLIPVWNIDPPKMPEGKPTEDGTPKESIHSNYSHILNQLNAERGLA